MISTSLDGQWASLRRGREIVLFAGGGAPPVGRLELESDDAEGVFAGPPTVFAVVSRQPTASVVVLQPPYLDAVGRLDLDTPMRLAAVTGPRLVLVSPDGKVVSIVRAAAGRGLVAQPVDVGGAVEFAVGLERNQILFGLPRKLEVWDAVSARPLLRLQLQLPPPPRTVGAAQGHLWVTRPGSDEVFVYRLSDGRPFRHFVGAPVEDVICHPASPLIVLVTARGLVRLHCFAHSLTVVDAPWTPGTPLGQIVSGDDVSLLGFSAGDDEPWRVPMGGAGAPVVVETEPVEPALETAADKLRAMRERTSEPVIDQASMPRVPPVGARGAGIDSGPRPEDRNVLTPRVPLVGARTWRDPLTTVGLELARGVDTELPVVATDTELGELAHRLGLQTSARRALIALYSLYLVGEPALSIARLAHALGEWTEPLGQGELGALVMINRRGGKVSLRAPVTDLLDGVSPRSIRVVGGAATAPRPGASRFARDGKTDAAIETQLATQLGRIGVIEGATTLGLLEARLHGATAVALAAPQVRPLPWPREAGLIVVADAAVPAWVAALPAYG